MTVCRRLILGVAVLVLLTMPVAGLGKAAAVPDDSLRADSVNRALATAMAASLDPIIGNLTRAGLPVDRAEVGRYLAAVMKGDNIGFDSGSATAFVDSLLALNVRHAPDTVSVESQREFMTQAARRPGATVTPSGLVFEVIVEGEGIHPGPSDRVAVKYRGAFSDGTLFDDTAGESVVFNLENEIPGFAEGLQMMKPGGTYRLTVPAALAYGEKGIPGIIPGNAALEFTVILDRILPPTEP